MSDELAVELSADDARAITDQIKVGVEVVWELIKQAYLGRAWIALGYKTWDDYCGTEFGAMRLRLPREERRDCVHSLRESGLSIRAIASATGVDKNTVQSDLSEIHTPEPGEVIDAEIVVDEDALAEELEPCSRHEHGTEPAPVIGLDGKTYSKQPKPQPKQFTFPARFAAALAQLQSDALKLEMLTKDERFAAHIDELCRDYRDGVVWAQEVNARVLAQMHTDQEALFGGDTDIEDVS